MNHLKRISQRSKLLALLVVQRNSMGVHVPVTRIPSINVRVHLKLKIRHEDLILTTQRFAELETHLLDPIHDVTLLWLLLNMLIRSSTRVYQVIKWANGCTWTDSTQKRKWNWSKCDENEVLPLFASERIKRTRINWRYCGWRSFCSLFSWQSKHDSHYLLSNCVSKFVDKEDIFEKLKLHGKE